MEIQKIYSVIPSGWSTTISVYRVSHEKDVFYVETTSCPSGRYLNIREVKILHKGEPLSSTSVPKEIAEAVMRES